MRYPGGKGRLWQRIVSMIPPHRVYIESHLGGGAVLRHKRPAEISIGIDADASVIAAAQVWGVPGLTLIHGDAIKFLSEYPFTGEECVYCDPPYVPETRGNRRYYKHEYEEKDHVRLLDVLARIKAQVLISGYRHPLYESRLAGWAATDLVNVTRGGRKVETIWTNFGHPTHLHDYSSLGDGFRERERIRRKTERWCKRIQALPPLERRALLEALLDNYSNAPATSVRGGHP